MKLKGTLPIKPSNVNIAVKRPTVNVKEAENVGEQAAASADKYSQGLRLSKHATFGPSVPHPLEQAFSGLGEGKGEGE